MAAAPKTNACWGSRAVRWASGPCCRGSQSERGANTAAQWACVADGCESGCIRPRRTGQSGRKTSNRLCVRRHCLRCHRSALSSSHPALWHVHKAPRLQRREPAPKRVPHTLDPQGPAGPASAASVGPHRNKAGPLCQCLRPHGDCGFGAAPWVTELGTRVLGSSRCGARRGR